MASFDEGLPLAASLEQSKRGLLGTAHAHVTMRRIHQDWRRRTTGAKGGGGETGDSRPAFHLSDTSRTSSPHAALPVDGRVSAEIRSVCAPVDTLSPSDATSTYCMFSGLGYVKLR